VKEFGRKRLSKGILIGFFQQLGRPCWKVRAFFIQQKSPNVGDARANPKKTK
jgi:hypothetical protein